MTSLIDKEITSNGEGFVFLRSDWVALYYDSAHVVRSDDGTQYAYRAITKQGEKLWLVFSEGKTRGYHAECDCPFEAFMIARNALQQRRQVKANWHEVTKLARDLRTRRLKLDVQLEDAERSPLCAMGIRHFLRSIGAPNLTRISGFKLAWMMLAEPQLGFVIHQAALREGVRSAPTQALREA
ncbi:MAG: hypothetical protein OXC60_05970 [Litoreibacter sp.]|nr:hypothetical protein [Litoreibacter sp.]